MMGLTNASDRLSVIHFTTEEQARWKPKSSHTDYEQATKAEDIWYRGRRAPNL